MKSLEFEVYPKNITLWMCALISTDGHITLSNKAEIAISTSVERDWLEHISTMLNRWGIVNSINTVNIEKSFTNKPAWRVKFLKRKPKGRHDGINQFISLYKSIEKWELEDFIMKRKFEKLRKIVIQDYTSITESGRRTKNQIRTL